jgi:hypothetical protein
MGDGAYVARAVLIDGAAVPAGSAVLDGLVAPAGPGG